MSTRKFTARERRQMVHALRLAKRRIEGHASTFICLALDSLVVGGEVQHRTASLLQEMIMDRISPYGSLNSWVAVNVGLGATKFHEKAFAEDIRKHRIKWLDLLIKEFTDPAKVTP